MTSKAGLCWRVVRKPSDVHAITVYFPCDDRPRGEELLHLLVKTIKLILTRDDKAQIMVCGDLN
jgi:hypothetical protein